MYVKTVSPGRKHVVIVLDHGNSLSQIQLSIAKAVAKQLLLSLGEDDRVAVLGLSSKVEYPREDACMNRRLCGLTLEAKVYIRSFIEDLEKDKCERLSPVTIQIMLVSYLHNTLETQYNAT